MYFTRFIMHPLTILTCQGHREGAFSLGKYRIAGNFRGVQISFFSFSVYRNENLTHETYVMMGVFSCVKWAERKFNTRISWR